VIDPERIKELDEIRQREMAKEEARLKAKIADLQQKAYWRGYHDAMEDKHRAIWRKDGIPNEFQDYWQLGYHAEYTGADFTSPALTIPYFGPNWQAQTIQYRLLQPPAPSEKYRFQAGLKASIWMADPDTPLTGPVLLCEGMKKAAVAYIQTAAQKLASFTVVAIPSKMPGKDLLDLFAKADPLYILLDPDAFLADRGKLPAINRLVKMTTAPKRIVKLPVKADDFFTMYGGTPAEFMRYVNMGTRA
jgi:hypothetical protein